jgi:N6-L-threonylcarbamoyladenine synthase
VEAARTLSVAWKIPVIRVNHMAGHIHSVEIGKEKISYPALALIVSGGHTEIIKISGEGKYKMLGATRDDAAGECFDKAAKMLGLPYPGGPQISKLALKGKIDAIKFPRPMLDSDNFDFSFAGLKTSALYYLRDNPKTNKANFCASFEQAIVDTLVGKMTRAIKKFKPKTVILCGGVSANKKLRETLGKAVSEFKNIRYLIPVGHYCMDNAAMIARAGYELVKNKKYTDWKKLKADPNWELGR